MDYTNATALDILDGIEKQFLIGEENRPIIKRDEKGRFKGTIRKGRRLGFRWGKGFYIKGQKIEDNQMTYAQVCLIGSIHALLGYDDTTGSYENDIMRYGAGAKAIDLLTETIAAETPHSSIIGFNDSQKTTFNDVINIIRKAKERYWNK